MILRWYVREISSSFTRNGVIRPSTDCVSSTTGLKYKRDRMRWNTLWEWPTSPNPQTPPRTNAKSYIYAVTAIQQTFGCGKIRAHVQEHQTPFQFRSTGNPRGGSCCFAAVREEDQRFQQTVQGQRTCVPFRRG